MSTLEDMGEHCTACGAKLEIGQIGKCDSCQGDEKNEGWFDVDAYSTRERWEGPDAADAGLDGFNALDRAIEHANSDSYKDCYQVTVVALGQHAEYDPGEQVYQRFDRPNTP